MKRRKIRPGSSVSSGDVYRSRSEVKKIDVLLDDLKVNMILGENVRSKTGRLLISRGNEVSDVLLSRLNTFAQSEGIIEPISVLVPYENSE